MAQKALLLVDLQNDFFPGGALAVPKADALFPLANDIQDYFEHVIATQDWHPADHKSFASQHPGKSVYDMTTLIGLPQVLWPDHCIQQQPGSELHAALRRNKIEKIIHKGTDPMIDSYSAFFDNAHQKNTGLWDYLKAQGISDLYIMGLATDYCVLYSVLDARKLGFNVYLIEDGCYGIEKSPGDIEEAKAKMREVGTVLISSATIKQWPKVL